MVEAFSVDFFFLHSLTDLAASIFSFPPRDMRRIKVSPTDEDLRPTEFVLPTGSHKKKTAKEHDKGQGKKKETPGWAMYKFSHRGSSAPLQVQLFHPDGARSIVNAWGSP